MRRYTDLIIIILLCIVSQSQFSQQTYDTVKSHSKLSKFKLQLTSILDKSNSDTVIAVKEVQIMLSEFNIDSIKRFESKDLDSLKHFIQTNSLKIKTLSSHNEAFKKLNILAMDISSLNPEAVVNKVDINDEPITHTVYDTPKEKINYYSYIHYFLFGLVFLLLLILYFALKSKINTLSHTINSSNSSNNNDNEILHTFQNKIRNLESDLNDFKVFCNDKFKDNNNTLLQLENKISDVDSTIDAIKSLNSSVGTQAVINNEIVEEKVKSMEEDSVKNITQTINVEYFVDSGRIKFRKSNSGSPFYMIKYTNKSELIYKESVAASTNYAEQIHKCFNIKGTGRGKEYRNISPAVCDFDENANLWILVTMGELESV